jgi:drug/metabolite transporter (DMT)-like permease
LVAFAANSILCRLALRSGAIDAANFSLIRLGSGALMLAAVVAASRHRAAADSRRNWASALLLFGYASAFSVAYLSLSASTGALILFGSVQATMIVVGLGTGERPHPLQWVGLVLALGGLAYLVSPGLTAPSFKGSVLMAGAGAAWGVYSLRGRGVAAPLRVTADNFALATAPAFLLALLLLRGMVVTPRGAALAVASGSITSGLGYVAWYGALRGLSATRAAIVQLAVPVIAAAGGVVLLGEAVSTRLVLASLAVLGGVGMAIANREPAKRF